MSDAPCHHRLDSELESLFTDDDRSIKSCLKIITSPSTDPTLLTRSDSRIESSKLLRGILRDEKESVSSYYQWRVIADRLAAILRMARQEQRNYRRRRSFKTGIKEIERKWDKRKKAAQ